MVESEEELKNLLMRVKEKSEEAGLKLNIQKMKIMASGPISSVQFSSVTQLCPTFCDPHELQHARPPCPSPTPGVTHVHWVGDTIQPSHPQSSPSPPTFNLSQHQGLFQWVSLPIRWPKYWSFSFNISPSSEYSGLVSFRMDWFVILAVQGTLKCLLQHHSSEASILWHSTFF